MDKSPDQQMTLKQRFLGSAAWTGLSRIIMSVLSVGLTATLARLLEPQDFGLLAMATVFTQLVLQTRDFGVGHALVQSETAKPEQQNTAFLLGLGFSLLLFLAVFFLAAPIAVFYGEPRVTPIVRVLALTFPISSFTVIPRTMLRRSLRMRGEAITSTVALLTEAATAISLAWFGFGVWALVAGRLASSAATVIGLWFASPWRPGLRIRGGGGLSLLRFGGGMTLGTYLWYAYSNADFLVVGRGLGSSALGTYSMAWNLAKIPVDRFWASINLIVMPLFARTRSDRHELGRVLCRLTRFNALLTLPAVAGLGVVAEDVIRVLLSDKWIAAVNPVRWLCVYGVARCVVIILPSVLQALGQVRKLVVFHAVCLVTLSVGFIFGLRFGPTGVAVAWALVYPPVAAIWLLKPVLAATKVPLRDFASTLARPAAATALMAAVVLLSAPILPIHGVARLVVRIAIGAGVYMSCIRLLEGPILTEIRSLFQDGLRGFRS